MKKKAIGFPPIMHGIGGLISRKEADYLYNVAKDLGPGRYAELGTFKGRSALCIAGGMKDNDIDAHLISVDLFDGRALTNPIHSSVETVQRILKERGVADYVTVIESDTAAAAKLYKTTEFNFVFIDADHTVEGCTADFEAWSPLVKSGGVIAFHDSDYDGPASVLASIDWPRERVQSLTYCTKP